MDEGGMREMVRDYVRIATGIATGVAEELHKRLPAPVRDLADGVVERALEEGEKAWHRLGDGVVQAGVVLEYLERQLRQVQGTAPSEAPTEPETSAPASRAEEAFPRAETRPGPVRVVVDAEDTDAAAAAAARRAAAVPAMRDRAPQTPSPAAKKTTPVKKQTTPRKPAEPAAEKAAAKKQPAAKKSAAKKATEKSATAKSAVKKTAAKKTAAKKTAAKKATPTKKAAAKKPVTEPSATDE